ncbi:PERICYCLE FACTOR TYPE-A 1 [Hibiscus trionum]|uniref:PERICYCLE FACTOR TYPE-A 1 n=1 Tax=Hibiscus trionum TaxID=183268 RepID=A0A9W7JHB1_HIBTR|nr:PERICYCLE FACTOR TYPE-A 1 [Hibiscus trionum]
MAEECTATSPPLHAWWDLLPSWAMNPSSCHHHHQNHNSHSSNCDQDDVLSISTSFTNASNHSVLTSVDDSSGSGGHGTRQLAEQPTVDPHPSNELISGEHQHGSDNHLWSHVLLSNIGSNGADVVGENLLEAISSKSNSPVAGIFEPAAFCGMATAKNPVLLSCYGNNGNGNHLHNSLINNSISMKADDFQESMSHSPCTSNITYGRQSKPLIHIHAPSKPRFRHLNLSDCKKQGLQAANSLQTRTSNGRTQGIANKGKKKRGGETSGTTKVLKKPEHENSAASSVKMHAPKVKIGDKITALQQIVSPFGKTDTASVLLEAIGYINFLQEQVQLLSNPYMKTNSLKDPCGSFDRKDEKADGKVDLRSKGLCLVPISCTPKVFHENTGSDNWSPTYRGCLYR